MNSKFWGALALLFAAIAAHAQGTNSPAATSAPAVESAVPSPLPTPSPTPSANPFKPAQAVTTPALDVNTPPPPPPIDPVVAAINEELRIMREQGERLGIVDGKMIYRYKGRYLVEALPTDEGATSPKKEQQSEGCVIRIVREPPKNTPVNKTDSNLKP